MANYVNGKFPPSTDKYSQLLISKSNFISNLRWPKCLTFHFHIISKFRILNSEICTTNFGIRNCEVYMYVMWTSGNSSSEVYFLYALFAVPVPFAFLKVL